MKGNLLSPPQLSRRQGGVKHTRHRVVCGPCNSGWMGGLEEEVRPIMLPLMLGQPATLTAKDQEVLARWLAMKIMVAECSERSEMVVPADEKRRFLSDGTFPIGFRAQIYDCGQGNWQSRMHRRALTIGTDREAVLATTARNVVSVAFGIGRLLAFVTVVRDVQLGIDANPAYDASREIYPFTGEPITWPPAKRLTHGEATRVAESLLDLAKHPKINTIDAA